MYLKKSKRKNGRVYLSVADGYHDPQKGHSRTVSVKKIGYLDDFLDLYDDPVAHFEEEVARMNAEKKAANRHTPVDIDPAETFDGDNCKNLGYAAISRVYHELEIDKFLGSRQRSIGAKYNLNSVMKLLVFSRLLNPGSKKNAYDNRGQFFERFDFTLDDLYRSLTRFNKFREPLQVWMHERIVAGYGRDTSIIYYDVTNYYFEIDEQDNLRRKGVSKEHRPDPIVQMGLFMDNSGLPVAYRLFPGNNNDCTTLLPVLKRIRREFGAGQAIVVADKGMNTAKNAYYLANRRGGYVFSQSVRGGTKELKEYVLGDSGYERYGDGYKRKSRQFTRHAEFEDEFGVTIKAEIAEKQVVFYSRNYDMKAKADRAAAVGKATALINNPDRFNKYNSYGAAKYIKHIEFDKETGEIVKTKSLLEFDKEKLAEDEKYDGYYVIVTSRHNAKDEWIIDTYKELWRIEETFKVTKSELETRPVYVSRDDHIEAHFLTCFVALLIVRLMQKKLGGRHSAAKILDGLANTRCSNLENNLYISHYNDETVRDIGDVFGIDFRKKYRTLSEIKKIIASSKINKSSQ
ncbi:MAG: IS1634 family transposase [Clostridiales Family XIII bacterium]|jgi:transposase|nr:IS1634 family transposase [Clostridiales Family XIII bacterium]